MGVEPITTADAREYTVQMSGEIQVEELQDALSKIDPDTKIQFFQLTFETTAQTPINLMPETIQDNVISVKNDPETPTETGKDIEATIGDDPVPEDLQVEHLKEYEYRTLQKAASNVGIKGNQKKDKIINDLKEHLTEPDDTEDQSLPLRPGHDPYYIMLILNDTEQWMRTEEIRDVVSDDWDVNKETVGNTLWHLTERDLVEAQPYEKDKRQNQYRLTEEGKHVAQQVIEFVEEEDGPTEIPLMN